MDTPDLAPPASAALPETLARPHTAQRAFHSSAAWFVLLTVLAAGLALDLGTKDWAFSPVKLDRQRLQSEPDWTPAPHIRAALPWGLLEFQLVVNRGAVFGIGTNQRFFFIAFTLAALAVGLLIFGRFTSAENRLAHVAIGMILAGGIGNLYDRIVFGVVRDFLHMLPGVRLPWGWHWPGGSPDLFPWVFNAADVLLLFGMALLMLHINNMERRRRTRTAGGVQSA